MLQAQSQEAASEHEAPFVTIFNLDPQVLAEQIQGLDPYAQFPAEKPLTSLQAYALYVHQSRSTQHQWLVLSHAQLRTLQARQTAVIRYTIPWAEIDSAQIERCLNHLLSSLKEEVVHCQICYEDLRKLAHSMVSAKFPFETAILSSATTSFSVPSQGVHVWQFNTRGLPGPPRGAGAWMVWAHATDPRGFLGILSTGKVVRSAADSVCLQAGEESHSFFGRVNQSPDWEEGLQSWLARLFWGTKNCSGVVFGGWLEGAHHKSP